MRRLQAHGRRALLAALLPLPGIACGNGPTVAAEPSHPIVGTYDVRTTLERHTYTVLCTTPSAATPYCPVTEPAGDASLAGTLVIGDTVVRVAGGRRVVLPAVTARLAAHPCLEGPPDCDRSTERGILTFVGGTSPDAYDTPVLLAPDTLRAGLGHGVGTAYLSLLGRVAGDSIAGTVEWATTPGRAWYQGTFVATRRR